MIRILGYFVVNILIMFLLNEFLPEFNVSSIGAAAGFIFILTLLNWTVIPIIKLFTLPINFITFGLVNFFINLLVVLFTANIIEGVTIDGNFGSQLLISLIIVVCFSGGQGLVNKLTGKDDEDDK